MTEIEEQGFVAFISDVLAFYRKDSSQFALGVWLQAMRPFSLGQVKQAINGHATDPDRGQFCPMPSDIVRQLAGTTTDRAALAWGVVFEKMQRVGAYTDVAFDDPAVHACIRDLGGWVKLCRTNLDEIGFVQAQFTKAHKAYTARGDYEYPRVLLGDTGADSDWAKRGLKRPEPTLIGNRSQALLVIESGGDGNGGAKKLGLLLAFNQDRAA